MDAAAADPQRQSDRDVDRPEPVVVQDVLELVFAIRKHAQGIQGEPLGVVVDRAQAVEKGRAARVADQLPETRAADAIGAELRGDVAARLGRVARRCAEPREHAVLEAIAAHQAGGRNHQAFLVQARGHGHGARRLAADVRMVGAVDDERREPPVRRMDRRDEGDVREMRAAQERVVQDQRVARRPVDAVDDVPHRVRHAAQMHGDVRRLCRQVATRAEDGAGEIEPVTDVRREGCIAQDRTHLVADGLEAAGEDVELYRVHRAPHCDTGRRHGTLEVARGTADWV